MKKGIYWIVLLLMTSVGSYYLYLFGQQHQIILENTSSTNYPASTVYYSFDGGKEQKINGNKKSQIYLKGPEHVLKFRFKDSTGQEITMEKEIELKLNKRGILSFGKIITDSSDWIDFKEQYE